MQKNKRLFIELKRRSLFSFANENLLSREYTAMFLTRQQGGTPVFLLRPKKRDDAMMGSPMLTAVDDTGKLYTALLFIWMACYT